MNFEECRNCGDDEYDRDAAEFFCEQQIEQETKRMSKVIDNRRVTLDKCKNYIPFLGGRPARVQVIGKDDITNLVIALNTTRDVREFISYV